MSEFKAPEPLKSEEKQLESAMLSMVDLMSRMYKNQVILELNKGTIDKFTDAQVGNYAAILTKLAKAASKSLVARFSNKRIKDLVTQVFTRNDNRAKKIFYERVAKDIGIDPTSLLKKDGTKYDFNALVLETTQWAQKLRDETLEMYTANTLRSMTQGDTIESILTQFDRMKEKRRDHAKFTARNQVANFNSIMNKTRAQKLGVTKAIWISSSDERTRPSHAQRDGKVFDLSEGLYSSLDGKTLLPGTDYQCFTEDSKVNHTSFIRKFYSRRYTGELSDIVTDDGAVLTSTANHPILTTNGFKAASLIDSNDYIIKTIDQTFDLVELYGYDPVPTFKQIFCSLDLLGVEHAVSPSVAGEFHGDISDGEINIVSMDSLLSDEVNSSVGEKFFKLNLSNSEQAVILDFFTCRGDGLSGFNAFGFSFGRLVSCLDLFHSRFIAHLTPLELFCFTLGSWFDPGVKESISYSSSTNSEVFSDTVFALSVLVHGCDIINRKIDSLKSGRLGFGEGNTKLLGSFAKRGWVHGDCGGGSFGGDNTIQYRLCRVNNNFVRDFSGHVYNLETISNDYTVNTSAVSNCRCGYRMIVDDEENNE